MRIFVVQLIHSLLNHLHMKKFFVLAAVVAFVSCEQPATETVKKPCATADAKAAMLKIKDLQSEMRAAGGQDSEFYKPIRDSIAKLEKIAFCLEK